MIEINIARDYAKAPGPRLKKQGKYSGEEFRESILKPKYELAKKNNEAITIILDGTYGYFDSFLEESFGGLARDFKSKDILKLFKFVSNEDPTLISKIQDYVSNAL